MISLKPRTYRRAAAVTFAAVATAAIALASLAQPSRADVATKAAIGQAAPSFSLPNVASGATESLSSLLQGKKGAVVLFIATKCPVSNDYNERMAALAKTYTARGFAFAGINSNVAESTAECAAHARDNKLSFSVLKDAGNVVADAYGATKTPEAYIIDAKGVLVYHGRIDNSRDLADVRTHDLSDALDNVLAGKTIAQAETKAFGCSIKRAH
ncbi:MAG TPA: thioredoxin family protein [Capsulimonadaceae bacterium]|jgi:peroxiredoxin